MDNKENGVKKYADGLTRSYGSKSSYQDIQLEYKKYRLIAGRGGKTNSSEEQLDALEKEINELTKSKSGKVDRTAVKSKTELSEKEILEKRIEKIELFLGNETLVAKLNINVIDSKKNELNKLKEQLNNL